MNPTDTPLDACPHCGSSFSHAIGKHSCHFDLETNGRTKLCLTAEALIRTSNQNTELKTEIEQLNIAGATAVEAAKLFKQRAEKAEAEVERLRGLLNAHAEFLIKNGFYRESRDLMGGSWSDGFIALAKKCGINPYDQ